MTPAILETPATPEAEPTAKRGPRTPWAERIFWTEDEKARLVDAWIGIIREDPKRRFKAIPALKEAMNRVIEPERHRHLDTLGASNLRWFFDAVEARLAIPGDETEAEAEAEAEAEGETDAAPEPVGADGIRPPVGVRWTAAERAALIAVGIAIVRSDPTGRLSMKQVLVRAQLKAIAPGRQRDLRSLPLRSQQWFRDGVEAGLSGTPAPGPGPGPGPEPPPPPPPAPDPAPTLISAAVLTPAPTPDPAQVAPDPAVLIALLLNRLLAERARDLEVIGGLRAEVRALSDRLKPLEASAGLSYEMLRRVMEQLDPGLMQGLLAPAPAPEPPAAIVAPVPAPAPGPPALTVPKPKICIVGIRPAAEAEVRSRVNGTATLSCILDDSKAIRHDYRNYDGVVVTRHSSHTTTDKIFTQTGQDKVIRLRSTSAEGVAEAVKDLARKHENEWNRLHAN